MELAFVILVGVAAAIWYYRKPLKKGWEALKTECEGEKTRE